MTTVKAVLLDIDGTLLNSNDAHAQSWTDVFIEFGFSTTVERVRALIGKGSDKLVPEVAGIDHESAQGKAMTDRRSSLFKTHYLPKLVPQPGTRALLLTLRERDLQLVIATSAGNDELSGLLHATGIADLIDAKTSSDDAESSKPDPDIVLAALRKARCQASEALMLGDTPYDVAAATQAGVRIIALRCGGWDDSDLHGAVGLYDDPADLLAHLESSPLQGKRRKHA